jgi:uncharacterized protein YcbX
MRYEEIGPVECLWRYPIMSMRGAEMAEALMGFSYIHRDLRFQNSAARKGFPYLNANVQQMLMTSLSFPIINTGGRY